MPGCSEVKNAMMSFTGTNFYSSDQHKEDNVSRQKGTLGIRYLLPFLRKETRLAPTFLEKI